MIGMAASFVFDSAGVAAAVTEACGFAEIQGAAGIAGAAGQFGLGSLGIEGKEARAAVRALLGDDRWTPTNAIFEAQESAMQRTASNDLAEAIAAEARASIVDGGDGIRLDREFTRVSGEKFMKRVLVYDRSVPGRPPYSRTGKLRASIIAKGPYCGPKIYYGGWVEFGTRKFLARPYMRPAMVKVAGHHGAKYFGDLPLARTQAGKRMRRRPWAKAEVA